jgi:hypothetical protein
MIGAPEPPTLPDVIDVETAEYQRMEPELVRDRWHRYKLGDGPIYPSITTVIGMYDKSGPLCWWAGDMSYKAVMSQVEIIEKNPEDEKACEEAWNKIKDRKYVRGAFDADRGKKGDIGTQFHLVASRYATNQPIKVDDLLPEVRSRCLLFEQVLKTLKPRIILEEFPCFNDSLWYAGTPDWLVRMDIGDGRGTCTWLLDHKTGESAYKIREGGKDQILPAEHWMQLTAGARAEYFYDTKHMRRVPMPRIERLGIFSVREDAVELWEWPLDDPAPWHAFVGLISAYHLSKSKAVPRKVF